MTPKLRSRICTEGRYFLFVLAFVVGSAIFRGVNLLYVLAGMMIAPLLFNWRIGVANMQGLTADRHAPETAVCGETFSVHVQIHNSRSFMHGWAIAVDDQLDCVDSPLDAELIQRLDADTAMPAARAIAPIVPAGDSAVARYQMTLFRRGHYVWNRCELSSCFPFGLTRTSVSHPLRSELTVLPPLGRLTRLWTHTVEAVPRR